MKVIEKLYDKLFGKPKSYLVICPNKQWAENLFERTKKYCADTKRLCVSSPYDTHMHCGSDARETSVEFISIHDPEYIDTQAKHKGTTVHWEVANAFLCHYEESVEEFKLGKEAYNVSNS